MRFCEQSASNQWAEAARHQRLVPRDENFSTHPKGLAFPFIVFLCAFASLRQGFSVLLAACGTTTETTLV
jgi:hypothetical protein